MSEIDQLKESLKRWQADHESLRRKYERCEGERVEALQDAERLRKNLLDLQRRRGEGERGEFWIWQGDEYDNVESLTCDVLVTAERMRKFVAAEKLLDENY